jgi:alpha-methylacyl-CoA racemase
MAEEAGPLADIRVLSLAVNIPGPVAAARLSSLGAEVTRVEPPTGDPLAHACPGWYSALIEGQRVLRLDLKTDTDRARLEPLLEASDLLLTSMRPAALERLALDRPALRARHPRLCHVEVTGYPAPDENRAGHDLTYQAAAGLVRPPELPLTLVADLAAAERVVSTALALLLARGRKRSGGHAQVPIAEAVDLFTRPLRFGLTRPGGLLGGGLPIYGVYPAAEGWIALAALEPHFVARLVHELELSGVERPALEAVFLTRTAAQWERWALDRDLPIVAVRQHDG